MSNPKLKNSDFDFARPALGWAGQFARRVLLLALCALVLLSGAARKSISASRYA